MRDYYSIAPGDLGKDAKLPILLTGDSGEAFYELAREMAGMIRDHNSRGERTVFIVPVGPVGQYPIFVRLVNRERLSLKSCWFINMDEYLNDDDTYIGKDSPLSFRGFMERTVYSKIDAELLMPPEQRVFPDPADPGKVDRLIEELGGVDIAFGGIGINGHLAFNDPHVAFFDDPLTVKTVDLAPACIRQQVNDGCFKTIEEVPTHAYTITIPELLFVKKLYAIVPTIAKANAIKGTCDGPIVTSCPASILRTHRDCTLYVDRDSASLVSK